MITIWPSPKINFYIKGLSSKNLKLNYLYGFVDLRKTTSERWKTNVQLLKYSKQTFRHQFDKKYQILLEMAFQVRNKLLLVHVLCGHCKSLIF